MIITVVDLLNNNPRPTDEEIRHGLEGPLCRCTGYQNIDEAVKHAAKAMPAAEAKPEEMRERVRA
jgi:carbon-monoxide dehydrogenase small subunit